MLHRCNQCLKDIMKPQSFKDLKVWQLASELAKDVATKLVPLFPREERFRLGDQIIRSSRSVPAQISEGFRKSSLKEKHHYYEMATTSNDETENHLVEAHNNAFIDAAVHKRYTNRVIRVRILLSRLMASIRHLETVRSTKPARRAILSRCSAAIFPDRLFPHRRRRHFPFIADEPIPSRSDLHRVPFRHLLPHRRCQYRHEVTKTAR